MLRFALLSLALLPVPALAASFQAETNTRPPQSRFVARDSIWRCTENSCVSTNETSTRPAIVCAALVRQAGALSGPAVFGCSRMRLTPSCVRAQAV